MKLFAVETTDRLQLCKINARNIKVFRDKKKAFSYAAKVATSNCPERQIRCDIVDGKELDNIIGFYDKAEGDAESAPILAYLSTIETSD